MKSNVFQYQVPRISLAGWSCWLIVKLIVVVAFGSWRSLSRPVFQHVIDFAIPTTAMFVSFELCRSPQQKRAFLLAAICLLAFWRYCLGDIVLHMHPDVGGLSFAASVADWWHRSTSSLARALLTLPFTFFVVLSIPAWIFHGLAWRNGQQL